jgi:hypothetical protein
MSQLTNLAFLHALPGTDRGGGAALAALVEPARLKAECLNLLAVLRLYVGMRRRSVLSEHASPQSRHESKTPAEYSL